MILKELSNILPDEQCIVINRNSPDKYIYCKLTHNRLILSEKHVSCFKYITNLINYIREYHSYDNFVIVLADTDNLLHVLTNLNYGYIKLLKYDVSTLTIVPIKYMRTHVLNYIRRHIKYLDLNDTNLLYDLTYLHFFFGKYKDVYVSWCNLISMYRLTIHTLHEYCVEVRKGVVTINYNFLLTFFQISTNHIPYVIPSLTSNIVANINTTMSFALQKIKSVVFNNNMQSNTFINLTSNSIYSIYHIIHYLRLGCG